jgi:hypothetical protein
MGEAVAPAAMASRSAASATVTTLPPRLRTAERSPFRATARRLSSGGRDRSRTPGGRGRRSRSHGRRCRIGRRFLLTVQACDHGRREGSVRRHRRRREGRQQHSGCADLQLQRQALQPRVQRQCRRLHHSRPDSADFRDRQEDDPGRRVRLGRRQGRVLQPTHHVNRALEGNVVASAQGIFLNPGGPQPNAAKIKADVIVLAKAVARHI